MLLAWEPLYRIYDTILFIMLDQDRAPAINLAVASAFPFISFILSTHQQNMPADFNASSGSKEHLRAIEFT
jgi:hypothetical protein